MTATYYVTLTDHGSERIAQAHGQAEIILVNLVLGDANGLPYDPISKKTRTSLVNQRASVPVQSVVVNGSIARVTATIDLSIGGFNIHELGLTDSTGKLVYIGNYHGGFKPVLANGASGELVLLIDIKADAGSQVLIQVDPTIVTANKQWVLDNFVKLTTYNAHVTQNQLEHNNLAALVTAEAQARAQADEQLSASTSQHIIQNTLEHNNLLALINAEIQARSQLFSALINATYHVGSWHGSNNPDYDPAIALKPLFGYETTWYLWPYIPAGVTFVGDDFGYPFTLEQGPGTQVKKTRIWQRLADGASAASYTLSASLTTVDEGQQVTFNLSTTGLAQGTPVEWNITGVQSADISPNLLTGQFVVGADGKASYTLTIVNDNVISEIETLKFALTYISNRSVNVKISDTTLVEQVVTINSDQTDINLLQLFTSQYGAPTNKTRAVFEIASGVNVYASSTLVSAIYGDHWSDGSTREIRVQTGAKIWGRGGAGGMAFDVTDSQQARSGGDGGTAIKAESGSPILVINNGMIFAGGGGGGASGTTVLTGDSSGAILTGTQRITPVIVPGTGGIPFGVSGGFSKVDPQFTCSTLGYVDMTSTEYRWGYSNANNQWGRIIGNNTQENTTQFNESPHPWPDTTNTDVYTPPTAYAIPKSFGNSNTYVKGGKGGAAGEAGADGFATSGPDNQNYGGYNGVWTILVEAGAGGLAGYIYQGPVTINNLNGGQSKGRTP